MFLGKETWQVIGLLAGSVFGSRSVASRRTQARRGENCRALMQMRPPAKSNILVGLLCQYVAGGRSSYKGVGGVWY